MKKKLVAFLVLVLAFCGLFMGCPKPELKAKDALEYQGAKYADQTITVAWKTTTYDFTENFSVKDGFEMAVYTDEALTNAVANMAAAALQEGNNTFYINVTKGSDAAAFAVSVYAPVTLTVTTKVAGEVASTASVEEKRTFAVPAAPAAAKVPVGKKFDYWCTDEACTVKYEPTALTESVTLYAKLSDAQWNAEVEYYLEELDGDYSKDASENVTLVGPATTAQITKTFIGYTIEKVEQNAAAVKAYFKRNVYTVTMQGEDGATIDTEQIKYGADLTALPAGPNKADDGETVYTFDKWVDATSGEEIEAVTKDVTVKPVYTSALRTYEITAQNGTGYTVALVAPVDGYVKGATYTFTVTLDEAYNQSTPVVKVDGEVVTATEGVYSATVAGNAAITVEGVAINTYRVTGNVVVANTDATYATIKSADAVKLFVDNEEKAFATALDLMLTAGEHTIEYKLADGTVVYSKTLNLLAEEALGDIALGWPTITNFTSDANGMYNNPTSEKIGWVEGLNAKNFVFEYTVKSGADSTEADAGYGFNVGIKGGDYLRIMFMRTGVRILYNGNANWDDRVGLEGSSFRKNTLAPVVTKDTTFRLVRSGDVLLFYCNDVLEFGIDTTVGFVPISGTDAPSATINDKVIARAKTILASDNLEIGIMGTFSTDKGKTLYNTYTKVSYTTDEAEVKKIYNVSGSIAIESEEGLVGFIRPDGQEEFLFGEAYDFASYKGLMAGEITAFVEPESGKTIKEWKLYKNDETEGIKLALKRVIVNGNERFVYSFVPEAGVAYKIVPVYEAKKSAANVSFIVKDSKGTLVVNTAYTITDAEGMEMYNGVTGSVDGASVRGIALPEGTYKFVVANSGVAFGKAFTFTVTASDVTAGSKSVDNLVLEDNIWGLSVDNPADWTIETDPNAENVAATMKVSFYKAANPVAPWKLAPTLSDGQMISFRTQYHGASEGKLAHGINASNNQYFNSATNPNNCDMYTKHIVGGADMGLTSGGGNWGGEKVKASPFGSMIAQFQLLQDYTVTYDLAYVRLGNTVYMLGKYGTSTEWVVMSKNTVPEEPATVTLNTAGVDGYAQNYTYSNFVYETNKEKVQAFYETNKDNNAKPSFAYDEATQTYSATIAGNGLSYTDVTGDKTKGTFTIEGTITTAGGAYAGVGFAIVDPNTGKFVNFTTNVHTGEWLVSTQDGNGWGRRIQLQKNTTAGVSELRADGDYRINISNVTDRNVTFKLKAVIKNNVWEVYVSENADNLDNLVKVATVDMEQLIKNATYEDKAMNNESSRLNNWNSYYPTADVVNAGFYSFSDGSRITKYSDVKISYVANA